MRLRQRLLVSFLSIAMSLAVVGSISVYENRAIEGEAESLLYSSIYEVQNSTALMTALQEAKDAQYRILETLNLDRTENEAEILTQIDAAAVRLEGAIGKAEFYLDQSREATAAGVDLAEARDDESLAEEEAEEIEEWLEPMGTGLVRLRQDARLFADLARDDPAQARIFYREQLGSQIDRQLLPLVEEYRSDSEEELSQAAQHISISAAAASRSVLLASAAAVVLGLILALAIAHSVAKPVEALRAAAMRVGHGELDVRVESSTNDEIGQLALSFNDMVAKLSRTTITKTYLDDVINTMTGALILVDRSMRIKGANRAAFDLLGYDEAELQGQPFAQIFPEPAEVISDRPQGEDVRSSMEESLSFLQQGILQNDGLHKNVLQNVLHKEGHRVPVSVSGSTLRDSAGHVREFVVVAYDISERLLMERRLRSSLKEKELLLREVHHRVKNNLQIISSLLDLHSEQIDDPRYLGFVRESRNRIRSMALIHEQFYRADDFAELRLRPYFEKLVDHLLCSFGIDPDGISLVFQVADLPLDLDRAIACGLILNELVSNSLEHAFPQGAQGEVRIELVRVDPETLRLVVSDNGTSWREPIDLAAVQSMGLTLVVTLVQQLQGTLELSQDGGAEFRIDFPRRSPTREQEIPKREEEPWPAKAS